MATCLCRFSQSSRHSAEESHVLCCFSRRTTGRAGIAFVETNGINVCYRRLSSLRLARESCCQKTISNHIPTIFSVQLLVNPATIFLLFRELSLFSDKHYNWLLKHMIPVTNWRSLDRPIHRFTSLELSEITCFKCTIKHLSKDFIIHVTNNSDAVGHYINLPLIV